jgi:Fe-S-cluster containining protein
VKIEIDLQRIEALAEERKAENWEFRAFLKALDLPSADLDQLVQQIAAEVSPQIDCTQCANCCKQKQHILDEADISNFTISLKMDAPDFQAIYLAPEEVAPAKYRFDCLPCPFLQDNLCTNYAHRPQDCQSFPHLHKAGFIYYLWSVIENYGICPIVFNVYERLKAELWRSTNALALKISPNKPYHPPLA